MNEIEKAEQRCQDILKEHKLAIQNGDMDAENNLWHQYLRAINWLVSCQMRAENFDNEYEGNYSYE